MIFHFCHVPLNVKIALLMFLFFQDERHVIITSYLMLLGRVYRGQDIGNTTVIKSGRLFST